jgi:hypothetical protein
MKKKQMKKLVLMKETLRGLRLEQIGGGQVLYPTAMAGCSYACTYDSSCMPRDSGATCFA